MFERTRHWFRALLGLRPMKDKKACQLKEAIAVGVAECKEKAAKGDTDASIRLGRFRENVTEQSVRLPGKSGGVRPGLLIFMAVLALAVSGGGCSGSLGAKTAKDIETAMEDPILPEYMFYVEADPKLKDQDKKDRREKVQALRFAIKAAQK